jgi:hypothetical protein
MRDPSVVCPLNDHHISRSYKIEEIVQLGDASSVTDLSSRSALIFIDLYPMGQPLSWFVTYPFRCF